MLITREAVGETTQVRLGKVAMDSRMNEWHEIMLCLLVVKVDIFY